MSHRLTAHEKRAIAVEARRDPRAIDSVLAGTARPLTELAIREAAERLGITLPTRLAIVTPIARGEVPR